MIDPVIGIQIGPVPLYDEGIESALDLLQRTAGVNTLFVFTHNVLRSQRTSCVGSGSGSRNHAARRADTPPAGPLGNTS